MKKILFLTGLLMVFLCRPVIAQQETGPEVDKLPLMQAKPFATVHLASVEEDWSPMLRTVRKAPSPQPSEGELRLQQEKIRANAAKLAAYQNGESIPVSSRSEDPNPPLQLNGFFGNDYSGSVPNDNDLAISLAGKIVSVTNTRVYVFDVNGNVLLNRSLAAFGTPPGVSTFMFDPRAVYDPNNDRFIVVYLAGSDSASSDIIVAFSQTNDPAGLWNLYALEGNLMPDGRGVWTDFPQIAISNEELVITGNLFEPFTDANGNDRNRFIAPAVWQVALSEGYAGSTLNVQTFIVNGVFTLTPVQGVPDTYGPHMFLLNKNSGTSNLIRVFTLTGTIANNGTITAPTLLQAPLFYGTPPDASQKNTNRWLQSGDGRISSAYVKDRKIHFVMGTRAFNRPSAFYCRINLTQAGLTFATVDAQYISHDSLEFGFPSICYSGLTSAAGQHSSFVFFNTSSPNHYPGNAVVFIDTADNVSDLRYLVEGVNFTTFGSDTIVRWGDYTDIAMRVPREAWVAGYYIKNDRTNATWISQVFADLSPGPPTGIEASEPDQVSEIRAYPNPAYDIVTFDFEVEKGGVLRAEIYDLQGQKVHTLIQDRVLPGTVRVAFNTYMLANGMYLLHVSGKAGEVYSKKFVVQH